MGFYQTNLTFQYQTLFFFTFSKFYSIPYPKTLKLFFYFKLSLSKFAIDFYSTPYPKTRKQFFYFKASFSKFASDFYSIPYPKTIKLFFILNYLFQNLQVIFTQFHTQKL